MEKRTANKAKRWNNEMAVIRRLKEERDQKDQSAVSGEYISRHHIEPLYSDTETKARNNERLLFYFFIGVVVCIVIWKGLDVMQERYWIDNWLEADSQKFLTVFEKENQRTRDELKKLTPNYKPISPNNYQIKTENYLKGSLCRDHIKTEIYESKAFRCNKNTNQCTPISVNTYNKKGVC